MVALLGARRALASRGVSLATPFVIAHRGGALEAPEHSFEAYALAYSRGIMAIEIADVQVLADGSLACQHDDTVDRTTDGTGSASVFTRSQWKALRLDTDSWFYGGYGNLVPPMFDEAVKLYANKIVFFPEAKDASALAKIVSVLSTTGVRKRDAVISSFSETVAKSIAALGWRSMLNTTTGVPTDTIANLKSAGIEFVAMPISVAKSVVDTWTSAGIRYVPYDVYRLNDVAIAKTNGAAGYYTACPMYLKYGGAAFSLSDTWADGHWMPGMIQHVDRGAMAAGSWGWNTISGTAGMLLGFLGARQETSATLETSFTCSGVTGSSQWFSIAYAASSMGDAIFTDGATADQNGYHILFRQSGTIQVYKKVNGASTSVGSNAGTSYLADGATLYKASVRVTPSQIIATLKNAGGVVMNTLTVTNSDHARGGGNFWHMRKSGWAGRFSALSLTPN